MNRIAPYDIAKWLDAKALHNIAVTEEQLGYDSIRVTSLSFKKMPYNMANAFLDAFTGLTFVARMMERMRLGTDFIGALGILCIKLT